MRPSDAQVLLAAVARVTAVKLLTDSKLRLEVGAIGIPALAAEAAEKLKKLPVVVCSRKQIWEYVGFKHVNGPQEWAPIAKAEYIARVHNVFKVPLLQSAAAGYSPRHRRPARHGQAALPGADGAPSGREGRGLQSRAALGQTVRLLSLVDGLGYAGVQEFLGLSPDRAGFKPTPVPKKHLTDLGDLKLWLFGNKEQGKRPLVQSQYPDLEILDEALGSDNGTAALRAGLPFEIAQKASRGVERLLRETAAKSEVALRETLGLLPNGFKGQTDLPPWPSASPGWRRAF